MSEAPLQSPLPARLNRTPATTVLDLLHLCAVWCLACAQPVLNLLSNRPEFFLAHGASGKEVLMFTFALCFLGPVLLWFIALLAGAPSRFFGALVVSTFIAALSGLLLLAGLKSITWLPGESLIGVAVLCGILIAYARYRFNAARSFFNFLIAAVVIVPAVFLLNPGVRRIFQPPLEFSKAAGNSRVPVVLVVTDAFPVTSLMGTDRLIDAARYPNFARLAGSSTWFRNAVTVSDETVHSVPAILTGKFPQAGKLPSSFDHPQNLLQLLSDSHEMHAVETQTRLFLKPSEEGMLSIMRELFLDASAILLRLVTPDDLAGNLPAITGRWGNFWQRQATNVYADREKAFDTFLSAIGEPHPGKAPFFFLHILLPHETFEFLPSGRKYGMQGHATPDEKAANTPLAQQAYEEHCVRHYQRHLLQVGYTDHLLGKLMDRLSGAGILESSLVVLTSDHGESHWPHTSLREVSESSYADILGVPLFVKLPFQKEGSVSDLNVRTTDIYATVLEVVGAAIPSNDGTSLLHAQQRQPSLPVFVSAFRNTPYTLTLNPDMELKYRTLERKLGLFGSGDPSLLYRVGPVPELLGQRVSDLPDGGSGSLQLELLDAAEFQRVDPGGATVPVFVRGRVRNPDLCDGVVLAVSVNGVVQAVTRPARRWVAENRGLVCQFGAMVPEDALVTGANDVRVYVLENGTLKSTQ